MKRLKREVGTGSKIAKLVKEMPVPRSTLQSWLAGTSPSLDAAEEVARYFKTTLGGFLGDEDHPREECLRRVIEAAESGFNLPRSHPPERPPGREEVAWVLAHLVRVEDVGLLEASLSKVRAKTSKIPKD